MIHPHNLGQKLMCDLAVALLQDTALELLLQPWGQLDQALLEEPLPEPMYQGGGGC